MPLVGGIYTAWAGEGVTGIVFRAVIAGICLLPPTILMGATLPAISRWVKATPDGVAWLGFFYGGNIAGGVDRQPRSPAFICCACSTSPPRRPPACAQPRRRGDRVRPRRPHRVRAGSAAGPGVSAPAARSRGLRCASRSPGMTALGAEVVWTRLLSLHFGGTVYTFSLILAVFLLGLGIGSTVGASMARSAAPPRRALGWCQLLLCGAMAWAAYQLTESLPYWPINPSLVDDAVVHAAARSRPLHVGRAARRDAVGRELSARARRGRLDRAGCRTARRRRVRRQHRRRDRRLDGDELHPDPVDRQLARRAGADHRLGAVGAADARAVLRRARRPSGEASGSTSAARSSWPSRWSCAGLLARSVHELPGLLVAYGRYAATRVGQADIIYVGEGLNAVGRGVASCRTACATTTMPARCRRRASRRTCGCSACSAT